MKKNSVKFVFVLLSFCLIFSSLSITKASANEGVVVPNNIVVDKNISIEGTTPQTRVGGTAVVKGAIKALLKNKKQFFNTFETIAGKKNRKSLESRFNKYVAPVLNKLLKYESLAWGTVEGQVYSALLGSGLKSSTARTIAYGVVTAMKWIF